MPKYLRADKLAETFRDMAEFASSKSERITLTEMAKAVEDLQGVDEAQSPIVWKRKGLNGRDLVCPICGFEPQDEKQPKRERWLFCPGCGNKCSEGGVQYGAQISDDVPVPH